MLLPVYMPVCSCQRAEPVAGPKILRGMVGVAGLEPATLRLSSACSNQLSYTPGPVLASPGAPGWWS